MKKLSILVLALTFSLFSCSSDDNNNSNSDSDIPQFAMTAKINGSNFQANNPFGTNAVSSTNIYSHFPKTNFVMLQARQGGILGNPEINIWLKKSQIVVGTYTLGPETFDENQSHHIDLTDNTNNISENTKNGVLIISEVNTTTKIVRGTFQFSTVENVENTSAPIDFVVTDGKFRYTYE